MLFWLRINWMRSTFLYRWTKENKKFAFWTYWMKLIRERERNMLFWLRLNWMRSTFLYRWTKENKNFAFWTCWMKLIIDRERNMLFWLRINWLSSIFLCRWEKKNKKFAFWIYWMKLIRAREKYAVSCCVIPNKFCGVKFVIPSLSFNIKWKVTSIIRVWYNKTI